MSVARSIARHVGRKVALTLTLIPGGVVYSPEALALSARFTTPPDTARKTLINNLIVALKAAGVWAKLGAPYLRAAADSQAARQNWLANQFNSTPVASPTFASDRGSPVMVRLHTSTRMQRAPAFLILR